MKPMKPLFRPTPAIIITFIAVLGIGFFFFKNPEKAPVTSPAPWYPATNEKGDPVFAAFFNRLPCTGDCDRLKFELVLYKDPETGAPTTYKLARVYVASSPEERIINEGSWTIGQGAGANPAATVYELDVNAPEEFRSFLALSEDILFVLDKEKKPRVGDGFYSYTLNRVP